MNRRIRSVLLCLCLGALTIPASAAAGTVPVAPPGGDDDASLSTAARTAASSGCNSRNVIAFKGEPDARVRHAGRIRCRTFRVRIRCVANLLQGTERINSVRSQGRNRCRVAMPLSEERYADGTRFTQNYRYKLTLVNKRLRWTGTTPDCPRRSKNKRTLTCRGSHTTRAPDRSVDRIRS